MQFAASPTFQTWNWSPLAQSADYSLYHFLAQRAKGKIVIIKNAVTARRASPSSRTASSSSRIHPCSSRYIATLYGSRTVSSSLAHASCWTSDDGTCRSTYGCCCRATHSCPSWSSHYGACRTGGYATGWKSDARESTLTARLDIECSHRTTEIRWKKEEPIVEVRVPENSGISICHQVCALCCDAFGRCRKCCTITILILAIVAVFALVAAFSDGVTRDEFGREVCLRAQGVPPGYIVMSYADVEKHWDACTGKME